MYMGTIVYYKGKQMKCIVTKSINLDCYNLSLFVEIYFPVEPNPPAPREVSDSSSASS